MQHQSLSATAHCFTVDVEEHFQVSAFERFVSRSTWDQHPSRVVRNTEVLLDLLARFGATGTFFVLGWVAERQPDLVRRIAAAGHEVASHGQTHRRLTMMTPDELRAELRTSKDVLAQITGAAVLGFRAPSFSIVPGGEWAFEVIAGEGYQYDSSLFPIRRAGYGYPSAQPTPHFVQTASGPLLELPMTTTRFCGARIPAAGGGYLRHFPYAVIQRAFRAYDTARLPGMFYVHPWELDPDQPRIGSGWMTRVRHYHGLASTLPRLSRLLTEFRFGAIAPRLADLRAFAASANLPIS
jgi:polysaccharide deacetylase family protein (PEP-CTERM system associated)